MCSFFAMLSVVMCVCVSGTSANSVKLSTDKPSTGLPECADKCRPTCRVPNPKGCDVNQNCNYCGDINIWDEDTGECVRIEDCPYSVGCNGDANASIRERPPACPSTCEFPNESRCQKAAPSVGCVCNYGFILSAPNGTCVEIDSCPGGNPCGANETFASCIFDCPTEFCPVDSQYTRMVCDAPHPCPMGCVCEHKYVWKNTEDRTCILSQECPEVQCKGQHEEWVKCPSPCFPEECNEPNLEPDECSAINIQELECEPRCGCKPSYKRDPDNLLCIPAEKCAE